jgi:TRAP-type C4-dicarboxylate transport system permease large subunit
VSDPVPHRHRRHLRRHLHADRGGRHRRRRRAGLPADAQGLDWRELRTILIESAITTGMIFTILIGALIFANFINMTGMPQELTQYAEQFRETPILVIIAILVIYVALGCVLESMSMILLTVPMFYPLVAHLGYDLIWFGIIVVVVTEISMITPPVGLNVFVLRSVLPDVPTRPSSAASCPSSSPTSCGWASWSPSRRSRST